MATVKQIMRYLKGTAEFGVLYERKEGAELLIEGHSDFDWIGDSDTRRSTIGYVVCINKAPISWCSKRQPTIALSSTKAEYKALSETSKKPCG
jgi:hypothetical protein